MTRKLSLFIAVVIITGMMAGVSLFGTHAGPEVVYIDAGLYLESGETLSVIVTGADSAAAAHAVEEIGGQVTGVLGSDDAVTANIPSAQLDALVNHPAVRAVAGAGDL